VTRDWVAWHRGYEDPSSSLSIRLGLVQSHLSAALDAAPPGPVRLLSLCAGQAHDVLGVLPGHPRRADVTAVLVEANPDNAAVARQRIGHSGLAGSVEIREADAGRPESYADVVPVDVLLLCGIFGNVGLPDIRRTSMAAAALSRPGAVVIWTRHRRPPDVTGQVREWFAEAGFDEVAFEAPDNATLTGVGVARLRPGAPSLPVPPGPLFTFR
jgi:hypothetical protein